MIETPNKDPWVEKKIDINHCASCTQDHLAVTIDAYRTEIDTQNDLTNINPTYFFTCPVSKHLVGISHITPTRLVDGLGKEIDPEGKYVISDDRSQGHDFVIWWCAERKGYTLNFESAGIYSGVEVTRICDKAPHNDAIAYRLFEKPVPWPAELIAKLTMEVVPIGPLLRYVQQHI